MSHEDQGPETYKCCAHCAGCTESCKRLDDLERAMSTLYGKRSMSAVNEVVSGGTRLRISE